MTDAKIGPAPAPSEEPVAWMVRSANYPLEYFSNEDHADIWANTPGVLDAVVSPLFASPAVAPVAVSVKGREIAWLIERKNFAGSTQPHWYADNPDDGWHWWTNVAVDAKHFASKAEAEAYPAYRMISTDPTISITEHVILSSIIPATKGGEACKHDREWLETFSHVVEGRLEDELAGALGVVSTEFAPYSFEELLDIVRERTAALAQDTTATPPSDTEEKAL